MSPNEVLEMMVWYRKLDRAIRSRRRGGVSHWYIRGRTVIVVGDTQRAEETRFDIGALVTL